MGTTAAQRRGGSTWRHHPAPYQTHTHTNTGGRVLYMYITPCDTLNMYDLSTVALHRPVMRSSLNSNFHAKHYIILKTQSGKIKTQNV